MPDDGKLMSASQTVPSARGLALGLLGRVLFPKGGTPDGAEATFLAEAAARLPALPDLAATIIDMRKTTVAAEQPLARAARALDLSDAEYLGAALSLAVETDAMAGAAVAYLQAPSGGTRPTLGLMARMLAPLDPREDLIAHLSNGAAIRAGLWQMVGSGPMPERAVRLPDGLIAALTGAEITWPGLNLVQPDSQGTWPKSLSNALKPVAKAVVEDPGLLLVIRSAASLDRAEVLARIAAGITRRPAVVDLDKAETAGLGALAAAAHLMLGITVTPGAGDYAALPALPGYDGPVVAFIGPEGHVGRDGLRAVEWSVPIPDAKERTALWQGVLRNRDQAARLGAEHLQSAGRIQEIAASAQAAARLAGLERPDAKALRAAFWSSEGEGLGALAHPVRDEIGDDALVAAPALRDELQTLLARCRRRERLTDRLGPAIAARYKLGVRALFTGPSGTGKTMGAAWLAGQLSLPLYRVDLASVVSKYIGETEKNLSKLLAKAEEQEVVLLFDEADALFGKRTDISDSNDRFANAQTNYLLQRIETYTGIVLLTSNARNRFDEAFTRRIDLIVDFLMPQPVERLALWQAHLGADHAVRAVDLNRLAMMAELAGGHIRNVVLMAAVLAGEEDREVAFSDLLVGLRAEYRKLGWTVPAELANTTGPRPQEIR